MSETTFPTSLFSCYGASRAKGLIHVQIQDIDAGATLALTPAQARHFAKLLTSCAEAAEKGLPEPRSSKATPMKADSTPINAPQEAQA